MDDGPDSGPTSVWTRWTDDGDVAFHEYCEVLPWQIDEVSDGEPPGIEYCGTTTRRILRITPAVVLAATFLVLVLGYYRAEVIGLEALLARTSIVLEPTVLVVAATIAVSLWLGAPGWIIWDAELVRIRSFLNGTVVYGLVATLVAGVAVSVYTVNVDGWFNPYVSAAKSNVVFTSGYLLMLFVGGYLVYDGMLRTENMFWSLPEKRPAIIDDPDSYRETFLNPFEEALSQPFAIPFVGEQPVPAAETFALLFLVPIGVVGLQADQGHPFVTLLMTGLDVVLVVVFFQFLVLIKYFNRLLGDHGPTADGGSFRLQYKPFHPDGYAGFGDFGRFSTRVNSLLVVGGLYLLFRLYTSGIQTLPGIEAAALDWVIWTVNHVVPVIGYLVAVLLWLYFSFWQLHKAMRGGRSASIEAAGTDGREDLKEYELKNEAPVWPINTTLILSIVSMDLVPVLGAILVLLRAT